MAEADQIVSFFKKYINDGSLEACQAYLQELRDTYEDAPWDYIFQKVYLHACLKKQKAIVDWLMLVFTELPPIQQIAVRQIFSYGRALLAR
jgi:trans-aconitate methyltransferase